jgi:hypothetical protein
MNRDTLENRSCSTSGLDDADSNHGSCISLRSSLEHNSQEHIAQTLQEYDVSQSSILHSWLGAPDLTFELSNELSCSSGPGTPLTSTPSTGSVERANSLHLNSPGLGFIQRSLPHPPALGRTAILQRRKRTKAFSVSSLSSSHSRTELPPCNPKRHAIYGDSDWQVDLPQSSSLLSSEISLLDADPAQNSTYATPPRHSAKKRALHTSTKSDGFSGRGLYSENFIYTAIASSSCIANQPIILPLRIGSSSGMSRRKAGSVLINPFMMEELLQEIEDDIQEWKTVALYHSQSLAHRSTSSLSF